MSIRIVLTGSKDSANVGAAARAMKNFGLGELYLAAPRCRIDERARALAAHAGDVLDNAVITASTAEALTGCTYAVGTTARGRASEGNTVLDPKAGLARLPETGGALVFGPEDTGLNNRDLDLCQAFITIPAGEYTSINLAQSVNILCYEWFQMRAAAPPSVPEGAGATAPREQLEGMYAHMIDFMLHVGYTDRNRRTGVEHLFRRMLDRAALTPHEVAALRGLYAQARWAADQPPERVPGNRT